MDIIQNQDKQEPKTFVLKIQETPLEEQHLRNRIMRNHCQNQDKGTYHVSQNLLNKESTQYKLTGNSFFDAFYAAYCLHGDVMISANDIWLTVCHQFSQQVNKNPEKYRDLFVSHQGKETIKIYVNGQSEDWRNFPCQENRWDIAMDLFSKGISEKTKGEIALLMKNDFSSSTILEQAAANICLMAQMKNYFDYKMMVCGCGIQNVHFVGGIDDFEYLASKIENLKKDYGLNREFSQYLSEILKIVNTFVDNMKNPTKVDIPFWNSIFDEKTVPGYGPSGIQRNVQAFTGWIKHFFGKEKIEKDKVPDFISSAPVLAIDEIQQKQYNLEFITFLQGIEEVKPNVYRPITQIKVCEQKQKKKVPMHFF